MMTHRSSMHRVVSLGLTLLLVVSRAATSQGTPGGFAPGARTIVDLEFSSTAIGDFPRGLRLLQGNMEVVDKDGVHMLRASSPSEFVLQLPEALPLKFTLEIDLIPKACCNPVDLMVEGVISGSRSSVSAQLEWDSDHFAVVGGNPDMFQMDMPPAIAATLPGVPVQVALSFDDETIRMYTNGKRVYSLSDRKFVRGRVLRVFLGGTDDDRQAVYLARMRVADAATTIAATAAPLASTTTSTSASVGGVRTPSGPIAAAGTGTIATTQTTPTVPASAGAVASGPITGTNPAAASSVALFAGPVPRTIVTTGFTASGIRINPQTVSLPAYAGAGVFGVAVSRQIRLTGFTAAGTLASANSRTITFPGLAAAGTGSVISGPSVATQRVVTLAGWGGSGVFGPTPPRIIALTGFTAAGLSSPLVSRTIRLPAIAATGSPNLVAPRAIRLAGWIASGTP
jgi:hypothetical protein